MTEMTNSHNILQRNQTTCVRGISVLLIAVFHVLLEFNVPRYFNLTGSVCVAAFLFLSGFGINESYKESGLNQYWYKRFKRIILPYTLFITILIPFTPKFSWKDYLFDITYIHSSYWFIEYLVWNYLIYWIAQRFLSKYLLIVFFLFGFVGLNIFMQMEAEQSFSFVTGIIVSQHIGQLRQINKGLIAKYAIASFIFGFFFLLLKEIPAIHSYKGTIVYNYILLLIKFPMAIPLLLLPSYVPLFLRSRLLHLCGIASLEIYLIHLALINLVSMSFVYLLSYTVLTIVLSYLFYQINNKLLMRII